MIPNHSSLCTIEAIKKKKKKKKWCACSLCPKQTKTWQWMTEGTLLFCWGWITLHKENMILVIFCYSRKIFILYVSNSKRLDICHREKINFFFFFLSFGHEEEGRNKTIDWNFWCSIFIKWFKIYIYLGMPKTNKVKSIS